MTWLNREIKEEVHRKQAAIDSPTLLFMADKEADDPEEEISPIRIAEFLTYNEQFIATLSRSYQRAIAEWIVARMAIQNPDDTYVWLQEYDFFDEDVELIDNIIFECLPYSIFNKYIEFLRELIYTRFGPGDEPTPGPAFRTIPATVSDGKGSVAANNYVEALERKRRKKAWELLSLMSLTRPSLW